MAIDSLNFLIVDVARLIRRRFDAELERSGLALTPGEARTLVHAERAPGLRQAALAERMSLEPMTLTGFLDRLEAAGLIERRPDPDDRRAKRVHPTAAAQPVVEEIQSLAAMVRDRATAGLAECDVEAVRAALAAMRERLASGEEVSA